MTKLNSPQSSKQIADVFGTETETVIIKPHSPTPSNWQKNLQNSHKNKSPRRASFNPELVRTETTVVISELKPNEIPQGEVTFLPTDQINVNPYQPREKINLKDPQFIELADSIAKNGILQPLTVAKTPAGYHLIAGERRWRAAKKVGLKKVPVHLLNSTPRQMLEWALLENIQRQDLAPMERAQALGELKQRYQLNNRELADKLSLPYEIIGVTLALLDLPDPIKDGLNKKLISEWEARQLCYIKNESDQMICYQHLLDNTNASKDDKVELIRQYQIKSKKPHRNDYLDEEKIRRHLAKNQYYTDIIQKKMLTNSKFKLTERQNTSQITITLKGESSDRHRDLAKLMAGLGLNLDDEIPDLN